MQTRITTSRGFADWLLQNRCSLAFTSHQTGELYLIGTLPEGRVAVFQKDFPRATGLHVGPQTIHLASLFQIWRFENALRPGEIANDKSDRLYVPRLAYTTGDLDIHEMSVDKNGDLVFVNTLYSCLATLSQTDSFRPLWRPGFISKLAAEDRCHLNGLGMENDTPRYASAVGRRDIVDGWRDSAASGGLIVDIADDRIVTEQLSMPHSPRVHRGQLWALDSGRGNLVRVDRASGSLENVVFCPGFLRGLAFRGKYAVVGLSRPREESFSGLELDDELKKRNAGPSAGINIVDIETGDIVQWLKLDGHLQEIFDVGVILGVRCPMAIGLTPEIRTHITVEQPRAIQ